MMVEILRVLDQGVMKKKNWQIKGIMDQEGLIELIIQFRGLILKLSDHLQEMKIRMNKISKIFFNNRDFKKEK